eukprot:CAMPEP_0184477954 /NCGR_PEP_ID=MMETSP0113_2-20130426/88_1 /TAXON_ID=91329 /ORGANISM="Norrisiella sphaerica, Strain BC52" /LENGTH=695 /DNA_ID=CAMNT_0026855573 /DNA_START=69 /DNA_END=2156 /DNA_ORIENTATION=+
MSSLFLPLVLAGGALGTFSASTGTAFDVLASSWPSDLARPNWKAYVYNTPETNWFSMIQNGGCGENIKNYMEHYETFPHSADLHFARAVTSDTFLESPLATQKPEEAEVFVVPALLAIANLRHKADGTAVFPNMMCNGKSPEQMMDELADYITSQPHYNATAHKHLFVVDHWAANMLWFSEKLLKVLRRGVVSTFEGRNKGFSNCEVVPAYVANCDASEALTATGPRIKFHFRGRIDQRPAYAVRTQICKHISQLEAVDAGETNSVCCSTVPARHTWSAFRSSCGNSTTACACERSTRKGFCEEMSKADFSLFLRGDTPISRRFFDALTLGVNIVRPDNDEDYIKYLPAGLPWEQMVTFVNVSEPHTLHAKTSNMNLQAQKKKMINKYAALVDWKNSAGVPASVFLINNAVSRCGSESTAQFGRTKDQNPGGEPHFTVRVWKSTEAKAKVASRTEPIRFVGIPNTGSVKFISDMRSQLNSRTFVKNSRCASCHERDSEKTAQMLFLREPTSHVVAQFKASKPVVKKEASLVEENYQSTFNSWLATKSNVTVDTVEFKHPKNMQTRYLSQSCEECDLVGKAMTDADLEVAKQRVRNTFFLGIKEYYKLSLCMASYQFTGKFPLSCRCDAPAAFRARRPRDLLEPEVETNLLSLDERTNVDQLVDQDKKLYKFALVEFLKRITVAQTETQVRITGCN